MDHLTLPSNPSVPALGIPFVAKHTYELGKDHRGLPRFDVYPATHLLILKPEDITGNTALLSLVQSWLYFGTICEFFSHQIDPNSMTQISQDGSLIIDSTLIRHMKSKWFEDQELMDRNERFIAASKCFRLLKKVLHICDGLEKVSDDKQLDAILFSIKILLCSLAIALRTSMREGASRSLVSDFLSRLRLRGGLGSSRNDIKSRLLDHMLANGWCYHQGISVLRNYCPTTAYYFACMSRKRDDISHEHCTKSQFCAAGNADRSRQPHIEKGCACKDASIDEKFLLDLLSRDKIPLVNCTYLPSGVLHLALIESEPNIKYTAVSHVWADGLGNPISNSMTQCQLRRLVSRLHLLKIPEARHVGETVLWMDTFCIPVEKKNDHLDHVRRKMKSKAIAMMTPIYARADRVVALDFEIQSTLHNHMTFTELTARLAVCGWMTRAWTLQEGALASKLCVQFKNGFLFAKEGQQQMKEILKIAKWNNHCDEQTELLSECSGMWRLPSVGQHEPDVVNALTGREVQLIEVWNSMLDRSTTKAEDLLDIVANLLDFSLTDIRRFPNDSAKMQAMLLSNDRLPMDFFSLPCQSKHAFSLRAQNLSWIPSRPRSLTLSRTSFEKCMRVDRARLTLDFSRGPFGLLIDVPSLKQGPFCTCSYDFGVVHPLVQPQWPIPTGSKTPTTLYLYLSHTSIDPDGDAVQYLGSAFQVNGNRSRMYDLQYLGPIRYTVCWVDHTKKPASLPSGVAIQGKRPPHDAVMSLRLGPKDKHRTIYRRPQNAATWGDEMKPSRLSHSIRTGLLWLLVSIAFAAGSFFLPPLMAVAISSFTLECLVVAYTIFKHYEAPRQWLRSYSDKTIPRWLTWINVTEQMISNLKRTRPVQWFSRQWQKFKRTREDRWERSADDMVLTERIGPSALRDSLLLGRPQGEHVQISTEPFGVQHDDSFACLGDTHAVVFRELVKSLPKTGATGWDNGWG